MNIKQKYIKLLQIFSLIMALIACSQSEPSLNDGTNNKHPVVNVVSITVTQNPTKATYYVNETFNPSGIVVMASYSDGSSEPVIGYSLSTPDMNTVGIKTVTVTFEGKITTFNITVSSALDVSLVSITVTQNPIKTTYYVNETFDPSGLVVTAAYSDGTLEPVIGYSLSTPDMNTVGIKTINVSFEDKITTFKITVNPQPGEGDLVVIIY